MKLINISPSKKTSLYLSSLNLVIVFSSWQVSTCWFGWCGDGEPIVQPFTHSDIMQTGSQQYFSGKCVTYQPITYRIFGIAIPGMHRTRETT
jgi:hypothetical protein